MFPQQKTRRGRMKLAKQDEPPVVLVEVKKSSDVTMVVRLMHEQGLTYIDIRDWLEAKSMWGRGYWFDANKENLTLVAASLLDAVEDLDESV